VRGKDRRQFGGIARKFVAKLDAIEARKLRFGKTVFERRVAVLDVYAMRAALL
jgi:hypothetical protein